MKGSAGGTSSESLLFLTPSITILVSFSKCSHTSSITILVSFSKGSHISFNTFQYISTLTLYSPLVSIRSTQTRYQLLQRTRSATHPPMHFLFFAL